MATGWEPEGLSDKEIADGDSYHRALYHDGDVENPAEWHKDSVNKLVELSLPHICEGSLVVDYGSGTGGSAIELLKALDVNFLLRKAASASTPVMEVSILEIRIL